MQHYIRRIGGLSMFLGGMLTVMAPSAWSQEAARVGPADEPRVAEKLPVVARTITPQTSSHPLAPALEMAERGVAAASKLTDYSATFAKRERIDGQLSDYDYMYLKVRHEPFSVYLFCLGPVKPRGQEAIYVEGRNDNLVLGHTVGLRDKIAGTQSLDPTSPRMMEGNLYPITNIGIKNLAQKLANLHRYEMNYDECEVQTFPGAKVDGRECTCIQVVHPVQRRDFKFHLSRTYYENASGLPIRFEGYLWPTKPGGRPVLLEEYTYQNLQPEQGFTDLDFDTANEAYGYR